MSRRILKVVGLLAISLQMVFLAGHGPGEARAQDMKNVKPVTFKVAHNMSPMHSQHEKVLVRFGGEVKQLTEGRVLFEFYPSQALGPQATQYDMAVTGIAEVVMTLPAYTEGRFPLTSIMNVPLLFGNPIQAGKIFNGLYSKFPELRNEYRQVKFMWYVSVDQEVIMLRDKPIEKMEDLKGMKIRTSTAAQNPVLEAWGATPINIPMGETYDAMQRGVVNGMIAPYSTIINFKLGDVTKYIVDESFFGNGFVVVMNIEAFQKLSQKDRQTIDGLLEKYHGIASQTYADDATRGRQAALDKGVVLNKLAGGERERFAAASGPAYREWVRKNAARGLPAQAIFDEAFRLAKQ